MNPHCYPADVLMQKLSTYILYLFYSLCSCNGFALFLYERQEPQVQQKESAGNAPRKYFKLTKLF